MGGVLAVGVALLAGLVSFLSPCVLPLVPAYVAYLGGQIGRSPAAVAGDGAVMVGQGGAAGEGLRPAAARGADAPLGQGGAAGEGLRPAAARGADAPPGQDRPRAALSGASFVAGLSLVFIAAFYVLGTLLTPIRPLLAEVAGVVVILMALQTAGLLRVPALNRELRLVDRAPVNAGPGGALLLGMGLAAGWTPCIGATLGAVLNRAALDGVTVLGLVQMLAYCAGLGLPFLGLALCIERGGRVLRALGRHRRTIDLASASILAVMGVLLLTDNLLLITNLGAHVLPAVPFGL